MISHQLSLFTIQPEISRPPRTYLGPSVINSKEPYLYADGIQDGILNASYSQLMGEMIGLQDALSKALAKKDQRTLNAVARGAASFVFLPVGF